MGLAELKNRRCFVSFPGSLHHFVPVFPDGFSALHRVLGTVFDVQPQPFWAQMSARESSLSSFNNNARPFAGLVFFVRAEEKSARLAPLALVLAPSGGSD